MIAIIIIVAAIIIMIYAYYHRNRIPTYVQDKQGNFWVNVEPTMNCPNENPNKKCLYNVLQTALTDCNKETKCVGYWALGPGYPGNDGKYKLVDNLSSNSPRTWSNTFYKKN